MPPRKRTIQSKGTPPTSPTTSTSHVSPDHHHLRHTGPSISTHAGIGATPSKPPHAPGHPKHTSESPSTHQGNHEKKQSTGVYATGTRTSSTKVMFVLSFSALLLLGWYIYGMEGLKEVLKDEVARWAGIVGDSGAITRWETLKEWGFGTDRSGGARAERSGDLEGSLNALADALGILPVQVASAVKPLIPPEILTSIASKETGGSEAVRVLYEDTKRDSGDKADAKEVAEEFVTRMGKGLDEEQAAEGGAG